MRLRLLFFILIAYSISACSTKPSPSKVRYQPVAKPAVIAPHPVELSFEANLRMKDTERCLVEATLENTGESPLSGKYRYKVSTEDQFGNSLKVADIRFDLINLKIGASANNSNMASIEYGENAGSLCDKISTFSYKRCVPWHNPNC